MRASRCRMGALLALSLALACGDDEGDSTAAFDLTFCHIAPDWVAATDAAGTWRRVTPSSGATYHFDFTTDRAGIAVVYVGQPTNVDVTLGSPGELAANAGWYDARFCGSKSVTGATAGIPAGALAQVSLGSARRFVSGVPTFQLNNVPAGPQTLVAVRPVTIEMSPFVADGIITRTGLNPANGATLSPVIDFESAEAFGPTTAAATVNSLGPSDLATLVSAFVGNGSASAPVATYHVSASTSQVQYAAVPAARLATTDWQALSLQLDTFSGFRSTRLYFQAHINRSITLGPHLAAPTITVAATSPNVLPRVQLPEQAEYNRLLDVTFNQPVSLVLLHVTSAWRGSAAQWDVTVPDFTGVEGWSSAWGLDPAFNFLWNVRGEGGTLVEFGGALREGAIRQAASVVGISPPEAAAAGMRASHVQGTARLDRGVAVVGREAARGDRGYH